MMIANDDDFMMNWMHSAHIIIMTSKIGDISKLNSLLSLLRLINSLSFTNNIGLNAGNKWFRALLILLLRLLLILIGFITISFVPCGCGLVTPGLPRTILRGSQVFTRTIGGRRCG